MPYTLQKVDYDINSRYGAVQACLRKKCEVVATVNGIGPHSCCSFLSYLKPDNTADNVFGNSRIRVPYRTVGLEDVAVACAHGELTALWNAFEDLNGQNLVVIELYIEMAPCTRCAAALENLLPAGTVVMYSFDHPDQVREWEARATALCTA